MKKNIFTEFVFFILVSSAFLFESCKYYAYGLDEFFFRDDEIRNRSKELKNLDAEVEVKNRGAYEIAKMSPEFAESDFDFYEVLVITDVHFGAEGLGANGNRRDDDFFAWISENYVEKGKKLPKFCVCLGDVVEYGLEEEYEDYENFTKKLEERFGIKTYNVVGNHDLYNAGWKNYKKYCFPYTSFYKFRTKTLTCYFLDSASGSLGDRQLELFLRDMKYNENGRKKMVFMHVPAYANGFFYYVMQNSIERNKFISYCAKNDVIALVDGHTHKESTSDLGSFAEYNLPGYLEKRGWGILSVDERNGKVFCKSYYLE